MFLMLCFSFNSSQGKQCLKWHCFPNDLTLFSFKGMRLLGKEIYATNFNLTHLLNSIQTILANNVQLEKFSRRESQTESLPKRRCCCSADPSNGRRTGSRETQNHGRCWVKHHPGHSSDLSLTTFRPAFEKIFYTLLLSQTCSIKQGQDARETQYQGTGGSDHFNDSIISSWPTFSHREHASIWKLSKVFLSNSFISSRRPVGKKSI